MKCILGVGRVLGLVLPWLLLDESCAYRRRNHYREKTQDVGHCPLGTRCIESSRCSPEILNSLKEPPNDCGIIYSREKRICCPEKKQPAPPPAQNFVTVRPRHMIPEESVASYIKQRSSSASDCGAVNTLQGHRIGGRSAKQGAWPWMVAISMRNRYGGFRHICTAAMITDRHMLSAAHCFDRPPNLYVARIGNINRNHCYVYSIKRIAIPDNYIRGRYYHDIAILTLTTVPENASPICLPQSSKYTILTGKNTTAAGWGATEIGGSSSIKLKEVPGIRIISNQQCQKMYDYKVLGFQMKFKEGITDGFICTTLWNGAKDTCSGDSGGPLMYRKSDHWYVVGVVSFGVGCDESGLPGGYTRVSKYLEWIKENIKS